MCNIIIFAKITIFTCTWKSYTYVNHLPIICEITEEFLKLSSNISCKGRTFILN